MANEAPRWGDGYGFSVDYGEIGRLCMDEGPPYRLLLEIRHLPELPQKRRHFWRVKKAADHWRELVLAFMRPPYRPPVPIRLARVACTRYSGSEPDFDNLAASFKPVLDALCRTRVRRGRHGYSRLERGCVLEDDAPKYLEGGRPEYRWEYAAGDAQRIEISIEEVSS